MVSIIQSFLSGGAEAGLHDETSPDHQYQAVAELSSVNLSDEHEVETGDSTTTQVILAQSHEII